MWFLFFFLLSVSSLSSSSEYYVHQLPGLSVEDMKKINLYSGIIETDSSKNNNLFFSLLKGENLRASESKLTIWLNGGPGCSSMDGLFLEIGPFRVVSDDQVHLLDFHWAKYTTILFVDQPVGTGYSFSNNNTYMQTQAEIAQEFVGFYQNFLRIFPEYVKSEVFLAGESFAGTYIPYIAKAILDLNDQMASAKLGNPILLKGLILGNAWVDPLRMYESYSKVTFSKKLISAEFKKDIDDQTAKCQQLYRQNETIKYDTCEEILQRILKYSHSKPDEFCLNMYDVRLRDTAEDQGCGLTWPSGLDLTTNYLNKPEVKKALHVMEEKKGWVECDNSVLQHLTSDTSAPSYKLLPKLLETLQVTFFNGEEDLICNAVGTRDLIDSLTWNGKQGLNGAKPIPWKSFGRTAGTFVEARNLSFFVLHNASHMISVDIPDVSMDMFHHIIGIKVQYQNLPTTSKIIPSKGTDSESKNQDAVTDDSISLFYTFGLFLMGALILAACLYGSFAFWKLLKRRKRFKKPKMDVSDTDLSLEPWTKVPEEEEDDV